jgi:integrase
MGTIYKRGRLFWIQYYRQEKPYQESTKSAKGADAKRLLKKREGEIAEGKLPGIYFDKVLYVELARDLEIDYELNRRKSLDRIKISLRHLETEFKGFRVVNITTSKIAAYIDKRLVEGAAHASINRELAALKRMLTVGARSTPPKVNRVPFIPMLKENNTRKGFFEHGEFISLRDALPVHLGGPVTFAYKVGRRLSEITGLMWNHVDLDNGIIRLEPGETKNDQGRTVYLDAELKEIFEAQREVQKKAGRILPYVFLNETGTDCIKRFDKTWRTACKKCWHR